MGNENGFNQQTLKLRYSIYLKDNSKGLASCQKNTLPKLMNANTFRIISQHGIKKENVVG